MDFAENHDRETKAAETKEQAFDKKNEYMQDVVPLLEKLIEVCDKHGLPYLFWVVYEKSDDGHGAGILMDTRNAMPMMAMCGNIADGTISLDRLSAAFKMYEAFKGIARRAEE